MREQLPPGLALASGAPVPNALIHAAMVDAKEVRVARVLWLEDRFPVEVDGEEEQAAGGHQLEQARQDHRHLHQVEQCVRNDQIGARPARRSLLEELTQLGVPEAHGQVYGGMTSHADAAGIRL